MDQRKYLIYFTLSLFLNLLPIKSYANSPWLPEKGKYKVSISTAYIDNDSKDEKETKIKLFKITEERIDALIQEIVLLKRKGYIHNAINTEVLTQAQLNDLTKELMKDIPHDLSPVTKMKMIEEKALDLANIRKKQVDELKDILCYLSAYQQKNISTGYIEYAPKNNMSFGVKAYYQEDSFADSKYTSAENSSNVKSAEVFYKYKIFQNKNFIFTVQPKFIFNNHSIFGGGEIFHELDFLAGITKKLGRLEIFTQMSVGIGGGTSKSAKAKKYNSYEITEGIKLPFGITLTRFTKHTARKNYNYFHEKNIYEQFSIAKRFEFGSLGRKNLTVQFGYFQDYNPDFESLEVSGSMFSLWSEI